MRLMDLGGLCAPHGPREAGMTLRTMGGGYDPKDHGRRVCTIGREAGMHHWQGGGYSTDVSMEAGIAPM